MEAKPSWRVSLGRRAPRSRRGVSPIIATILLVAITVVLAAVLYVLISGLTGGGTSTPYNLQMSNGGQTNPVAGTFFITMTLNPTSGLTTGLFGLKITDINSAAVTGAAPPAGCHAGVAFSGANCPKATAASTNWYVALVYSNGTVANVYGTAGWTGTTVLVNGAMTLVVITGASVASVGDKLSAFSTSTASVSGQVSL